MKGMEEFASALWEVGGKPAVSAAATGACATIASAFSAGGSGVFS